jgi:putative FmdB family regulatory protein
MPTYEFRCPKGHEFEKFYRSMSAAPLQVSCPTCGKTAERQFSAGAGLVFKGSGFYITDYGKDGKKAATPAAASGEAGSKASPAESGAAKSEAAGKSDAKPGPDSKSGAESKSTAESKPSGDSKPATASKSAAKKSSGRAKSSE